MGTRPPTPIRTGLHSSATPPHPEYPAAHAAIQRAGAVVLTSYFGRRYAFETTSPTVPDVRRAYRSFYHFASEGAAARIFGGMHFLTALTVGARQGDGVAGWVLEHYLRPVHDDKSDGTSRGDTHRGGRAGAGARESER